MIKPLTVFNPSFKQKYVNFDNSSVNVNKEAIKQAKRQLKIRKTVEENIKQSKNESLKSGNVYFTIFSDGSCRLYKSNVMPIWQGKAEGVNVKKDGWISNEINAMSVSYGYSETSDEAGNVRAHGNGYKFATIYPDGDIFMHKNAEEIFPEED